MALRTVWRIGAVLSFVALISQPRADMSRALHLIWPGGQGLGGRRPGRGAILAGLWLGWAGLPAEAQTEPACLPYIQEQTAWRSATFRPHTDAFRPCPVAEDTYRRVVGEWLRLRPPAGEPPNSLGLGRLVDYPWLSRHLAQASLKRRDWNARTGRARGSDINRVVADILSAPEPLARLQQAFAGSGYTVVAVTVEKVLVGPAREVLGEPGLSRARVPYDAMIWLRLEYRPPVR